jgi:tetratricopeptide (TPR) repeat protein
VPDREVSAGLLKSAQQAVSQGRADWAITLFRRIQDKYPDAPERPEAALLLAQALETRGDAASALSEYRRLISDFPQSPQAIPARIKIPALERQLEDVPVGKSLMGAVYLRPDKLDLLDERELLRLLRPEINMLVVEVTRQGVPSSPQGVYFKTDWAPVIRDRLASVIAMARGHRLGVWAAVSIRRMDWIDPELGWSDWRYNSQSGELSAGEASDLMHPGVSEYLLGFLMDLAATGIDGVLLTADSPSGPADGFSPFARRAYEQDMGERVDPGKFRLAQAPGSLNYAPGFWRWIGWKQRSQLKVIDSIFKAVRKSYPNLKVAIELHPEAVTNPRAALAWYAEDMLDLRRSRFDYVVLPLIPALESSAKKVADSLNGNGKRLLLVVESASPFQARLSSFPNGTGLIFKEKVHPGALTNRGR